MAKEARVQRKERVPVNGARDILTVAQKDPNYEYRWVIDRPGRFAKFSAAGWEVVTDDLEVGQPTVDRGSKVGSAVTKLAGQGSTLVLHRIPIEWYNEDQLAKQINVDSLEASMQDDLRRNVIPGSTDPGYGGSIQRGAPGIRRR